MVDFPNTPNPGDEHTEEGRTWIWDGTAWIIKPIDVVPTQTMTVGPTLPNPAVHGQQHYLTVEPVGTYVYLDETALGTGSSRQWIQQNGGSLVPNLPETNVTLINELTTLDAGTYSRSATSVGAASYTYYLPMRDDTYVDITGVTYWGANVNASSRDDYSSYQYAYVYDGSSYTGHAPAGPAVASTMSYVNRITNVDSTISSKTLGGNTVLRWFIQPDDVAANYQNDWGNGPQRTVLPRVYHQVGYSNNESVISRCFFHIRELLVKDASLINQVHNDPAGKLPAPTGLVGNLGQPVPAPDAPAGPPPPELEFGEPNA